MVRRNSVKLYSAKPEWMDNNLQQSTTDLTCWQRYWWAFLVGKQKFSEAIKCVTEKVVTESH